MSYVYTRVELEKRAANFADDVLDYLIKTGRAERGRSYFGVLACGNPALVARLEGGSLPGLEVMLRVWEFMENNPAPDKRNASAESGQPQAAEAAE